MHYIRHVTAPCNGALSEICVAKTPGLFKIFNSPF